ncbi:MAG: MFS transporter [Dehalococcoidales bacterium]|nr:MFS transporter [Dehalococcoidales bacterium]
MPDSVPQKHKMNVTALWRRYPPVVWVLTGIDFFVTCSFSVSFPFLALYLNQVRGVDMSLVGLLFLIGGLCAAATNMVGGMLSDRFGRRKLLLLVTVTGIFAYIGLALLVGFSVDLWIISLAYITARGILGTVNPTVGAIIADVAPKDKLTEIYAVVRIGGNIGFALAPGIGGYMLGILSYGWLLGFSAIACGGTALLVLLFLRESFTGNGGKVNLRSTLAVAKDRSFLIFSILCMLLFASMAQLGSTLSIFSVETLKLSTAEYGLLLTTNGVIVVLTQYPAAWLMSKFPINKGLMVGSLLYGFGYLTLGWVNHFNWAILAIVLITFGEVVFSPLSSVVVARAAPDDKRGRYMGFFGLSSTVGFSFAPLIGGILLDVFPRQPLFLWGTIALAGGIAAVGFYYWGRKPKTTKISV